MDIERVGEGGNMASCNCAHTLYTCTLYTCTYMYIDIQYIVPNRVNCWDIGDMDILHLSQSPVELCTDVRGE